MAGRLSWSSNVLSDFLGNYFTILHVCIKECHFLRNLKLEDCELIREITCKLQTLSAKRCKSVKYMNLAGECYLRELLLYYTFEKLKEFCQTWIIYLLKTAHYWLPSVQGCRLVSESGNDWSWKQDVYFARNKDSWLICTLIKWRFNIFLVFQQIHQLSSSAIKQQGTWMQNWKDGLIHWVRKTLTIAKSVCLLDQDASV